MHPTVCVTKPRVAAWARVKRRFAGPAGAPVNDRFVGPLPHKRLGASLDTPHPKLRRTERSEAAGTLAVKLPSPPTSTPHPVLRFGVAVALGVMVLSAWLLRQWQALTRWATHRSAAAPTDLVATAAPTDLVEAHLDGIRGTAYGSEIERGILVELLGCDPATFATDPHRSQAGRDGEETPFRDARRTLLQQGYVQRVRGTQDMTGPHLLNRGNQHYDVLVNLRDIQQLSGKNGRPVDFVLGDTVEISGQGNGCLYRAMQTIASIRAGMDPQRAADEANGASVGALRLEVEAKLRQRLVDDPTEREGIEGYQAMLRE